MIADSIYMLIHDNYNPVYPQMKSRIQMTSIPSSPAPTSSIPRRRQHPPRKVSRQRRRHPVTLLAPVQRTLISQLQMSKPQKMIVNLLYLWAMAGEVPIRCNRISTPQDAASHGE